MPTTPDLETMFTRLINDAPSLIVLGYIVIRNIQSKITVLNDKIGCLERKIQDIKTKMNGIKCIHGKCENFADSSS